VRSVPKLYNEEQLRLSESSDGSEKEYEVGVRWPPAWKLVVRQAPASKDVKTETEEATALGAVTRRQPVKIQQTEKT
jgi:hypothetical protein